VVVPPAPAVVQVPAAAVTTAGYQTPAPQGGVVPASELPPAPVPVNAPQ
jgi:hypothetical protein